MPDTEGTASGKNEGEIVSVNIIVSKDTEKCNTVLDERFAHLEIPAIHSRVGRLLKWSNRLPYRSKSAWVRAGRKLIPGVEPIGFVPTKYQKIRVYCTCYSAVVEDSEMISGRLSRRATTSTRMSRQREDNRGNHLLHPQIPQSIPVTPTVILHLVHLNLLPFPLLPLFSLHTILPEVKQHLTPLPATT